MNTVLKKFAVSLGAMVILGTTVVSASGLSLSDVALRQQMIDFARFFPNLVSQYYPDYSSDGTQGNNAKLGSVATLDSVDNPYVSIGGVRTYYYSKPMTATSSIVCSVLNPFNATSTLISYSAYARASALTAAELLSLSTSTSAYASSSQNYVLDFSAAAGQGFAFSWTTPIATTSTRVIGLTDVNNVQQFLNVIKPGEWLNLRIATSSPGANGSTGSYTGGLCKGVIQSIGN